MPSASHNTAEQPHRLVTIILHIILIVLAYSAPWWLDWRLVVAGVLIYYVQLLIFGWCVLSLRQFGEKKTFHEWYLAKFGLHPDPVRLRWVLNYVIPPLLVVIAIVWQIGLNRTPLVAL